MFCENCGTELQDPNQKFCPNCGIPLKNKIQLNSKETLVILDSHAGKIWIWQGNNTAVREKFIAREKAKFIRDKYGIGYIVEEVIEGTEPSDFKELIEGKKLKKKRGKGFDKKRVLKEMENRIAITDDEKSKLLKHNSRDIKRIDPQLKDEIQSFLDWIKDREGLAGYINYYLQQNNTQVISKLSKIYNELKQITTYGIQKNEKMVNKSKNSRGILKSMHIDPETAVSDMMHSNPNIIAAAVIKGNQIIYTTDNWDISGDVDRFLSSWFGQNAQFIMVSGVKYSILQMEAERLVAMSYKGEESIVATKDDEYILVLHFSKRKLDEGGGDFPFPYIFKPPSPPGDLTLAGESQTKLHIIEQILEYESYCKHCGAELPKGQTVCHVCGKKI